MGVRASGRRTPKSREKIAVVIFFVLRVAINDHDIGQDRYVGEIALSRLYEQLHSRAGISF